MVTGWNRDGWTPQIGELVRIRSWDDMVSEFGISERGVIPCEDSFVPEMRAYCGHEFVITDIDYSSVKGHGLNYSVTFDMIEPIGNEEIELEDEQLVEFLNNFC